MTHPAPIDDDPLYKFAEAMAYLRVGRNTIYRLMQLDALVGHKVGSTWRFRRSALDRVVRLATIVKGDVPR